MPALRFWPGRLMWGRLMWGCAIAVALGSAWWAHAVVNWRDAFPLREIRVEGRFEHVDSQRVVDTVAPLSAEGFFGADMRTIKRALEELPWVKAAWVRRIWPDALQVTLDERQAVARWREQGLVSSDGTVFFPQQLVGQQLPVLVMPQVSGKVDLDRYYRMRDALKAVGLEIVRFDVDGRRAVHITLGNGASLLLGRREGQHRLERC